MILLSAGNKPVEGVDEYCELGIHAAVRICCVSLDVQKQWRFSIVKTLCECLSEMKQIIHFGILRMCLSFQPVFVTPDMSADKFPECTISSDLTPPYISQRKDY